MSVPNGRGFLRGRPQLIIGLGVVMLRHPTINLEDEGAHDHRRYFRERCGGTADVMRKARGGSNETNKCNNQPVREHTQQHTHPGGGGGSRGSRRGRRRTRGTRGRITRTAPSRGAPRNPLSPFPWRRRRRSPGLFLSSCLGHVWMDKAQL